MEQGLVNSKIAYLENDSLRVALDPATGGKIRSFYSKRSGIEYFYQDRRASFADSSYSQHDISGMDECFPTVRACRFRLGSRQGVPLQDHGWLWDKPWAFEHHAKDCRMILRLTEWPLTFERLCRLSDHGLEFEYAITNHASEPFPFLYCAHLMLAGDSGTIIEYPSQMTRAYLDNIVNMENVQKGSWVNWPPHDKSLWEPLSGDRGSAAKFFSGPLTEGQTAIRHGNLEKLQISFDTQALPHLGVMLSQGFGPTGKHDGTIIVGLEPTTGIGDDLPTCEITKTLKQIEPAEELRFWITLSLTSAT